MNRTETPVLLLHGIPGSRRTWDKVAPLLETKRVVAPDLLGFGNAPPFRGDGHAREQAAALLDLMDREDLDPVHVVGFDFGGPVAVMLAASAPQRVAGITLVATNVLVGNPVPRPLRLAGVPVLGALFYRLMCSRAGLAMMWRAATRQRRRFPYREFRAVADRRGRASTERIFRDSIANLQQRYEPVESALPSLPMPVTVVWADHDPFFSTEAGRRTASRIPGARLVIVADCGHFVPEEKPEELAAIIRESLAGRAV